MFLWTILYLVKASFLALCWCIFSVSARFRLIWWMISIFTFLTYWPILLGELWACGSPAAFSDPATCYAFIQTDAYQQYMINGASMATALHISSDLLILALPLLYIRSLQMSKLQKFNAGAVFALVFLDIAMGLIRNIAAALPTFNNSSDVANFTGVLLVFEPSLAVIVSALPAYKALSLARKRRERLRNEEAQRHQGSPTPNRQPPHMILDDSIAELERPWSSSMNWGMNWRPVWLPLHSIVIDLIADRAKTTFNLKTKGDGP